MGFLSDIGRVGVGIGTFGLSEVANEATGGGLWGEGSTFTGLGDVVRGKKDKGVPDKFLELDPSLRAIVEQGRRGQGQGLSLYSKELERLGKLDPKKTAELMQTKGVKAIKGASEDEKRRAQQLVAQRGLNRSSIGLNTMLNADRRAGEKIAELKSNAPLMEEKARRDRMSSIGGATTGINQVLASPGQQRDFIQGRTGGTRSGGLLGLLGGAAGAYAAGQAGGNPYQGFRAGQGLGTGLANF